MSRQIETVKRYFQAIQDRKPGDAAAMLSPSYLEHDPGVGHGVAGVATYVRQLKESDQQILLRIFEDGVFVCTQMDGSVNGLNTFFDVFRLDGELIAEHWRFSAKAGPPNKSGHTQVDGPVEARDLDQTERNKAFLRNYYETFHLNGDHSNWDEYFTEGQMIRHEPGVHDGVQPFLDDVKVLMQHRTIDRIKLLLGQGDFVFLVAEGTHEAKPCLYIDLYRIENLKIVEHWGFPQAVPETLNHANGMV